MNIHFLFLSPLLLIQLRHFVKRYTLPVFIFLLIMFSLHSSKAFQKKHVFTPFAIQAVLQMESFLILLIMNSVALLKINPINGSSLITSNFTISIPLFPKSLNSQPTLVQPQTSSYVLQIIYSNVCINSFFCLTDNFLNEILTLLCPQVEIAPKH